jgi:hypothetical protein
MQSLQQATRSQYTCGAKPSWIMPGGQVWPPWLHVAGRGWPGTIWQGQNVILSGIFCGQGWNRLWNGRTKFFAMDGCFAMESLVLDANSCNVV